MTASIEERRAFAEYLADCDANAIVPDVAGAFAWAWRKPAEAAVKQARIDAQAQSCVPAGMVLASVELLKRAESSLGSFCSDHGWGDADMQAMDDISGLLAASPQPQPACPTCSGHGMIGGPSFYAPDEGGVPCPDCNQPQPVQASEHVPEVHFGKTMKPETLRVELQKMCSAWGAYWRGSDAHGVELTTEQAVDLLQSALNVEVEIKDEEAAQQANPSTDSIVQAAVIRALDEANVRDEVLRGMCIEVALEKASDMLEGLK